MKKPPSRVGLGASSVLLILVAVCLTMFAALSLVQARRDAALARKTEASVRSYYNADVRAQEMLAELDAAWRAGGDPASIEGVTEQGGAYAFSVGTDDAHALNVLLDFDGGGMRVIRYRYESVGEWTAGGGDALWQG